MKDKINKWYNLYHLWTIQMVRNAVAKGIITRAEYLDITGELYE